MHLSAAVTESIEGFEGFVGFTLLHDDITTAIINKMILIVFIYIPFLIFLNDNLLFITLNPLKGAYMNSQ